MTIELNEQDYYLDSFEPNDTYASMNCIIIDSVVIDSADDKWCCSTEAVSNYFQWNPLALTSVKFELQHKNFLSRKFILKKYVKYRPFYSGSNLFTDGE